MRSVLEQERKSILEQMHASREIYRELLQKHAGTSEKKGHFFPRSRTVQWIQAHPLITGTAGVTLLWLMRARFQYKHQLKDRSKKNPAAISPFKLLFAIIAVILQNPSRLNAATHIAGSIIRSLKK